MRYDWDNIATAIAAEAAFTSRGRQLFAETMMIRALIVDQQLANLPIEGGVLIIHEDEDDRLEDEVDPCPCSKCTARRRRLN